MKFYICSDFHADASTNGLDRHDEIREAAFVVADAAIEEQRQSQRSEVFFVFTGDLCDPDTTRSFRAIALAIELAFYLDRNGVKSIWLAGNHDVIEDAQGSTVLAPLHAAARASFRVTVIEAPFSFCAGNRHLVFLPYVARAKAYDPTQFVSSCWVTIPDECRGGDTIVFGHLTVPSAERGSESDDFARGRDLVFPVETCYRLFGDRTILVNGHYHRKQVTKDGVHIPGSLARLRHDEEHHDPGYLVIEV